MQAETLAQEWLARRPPGTRMAPHRRPSFRHAPLPIFRFRRLPSPRPFRLRRHPRTGRLAGVRVRQSTRAGLTLALLGLLLPTPAAATIAVLGQDPVQAEASAPSPESQDPKPSVASADSEFAEAMRQLLVLLEQNAAQQDAVRIQLQLLTERMRGQVQVPGTTQAGAPGLPAGMTEGSAAKWEALQERIAVLEQQQLETSLVVDASLQQMTPRLDSWLGILESLQRDGLGATDPTASVADAGEGVAGEPLLQETGWLQPWLLVVLVSGVLALGMLTWRFQRDRRSPIRSEPLGTEEGVPAEEGWGIAHLLSDQVGKMHGPATEPAAPTDVPAGPASEPAPPLGGASLPESALATEAAQAEPIDSDPVATVPEAHEPLTAQNALGGGTDEEHESLDIDNALDLGPEEGGEPEVQPAWAVPSEEGEGLDIEDALQLGIAERPEAATSLGGLAGDPSLSNPDVAELAGVAGQPEAEEDPGLARWRIRLTTVNPERIEPVLARFLAADLRVLRDPEPVVQSHEDSLEIECSLLPGLLEAEREQFRLALERLAGSGSRSETNRMDRKEGSLGDPWL